MNLITKLVSTSVWALLSILALVLLLLPMKSWAFQSGYSGYEVRLSGTRVPADCANQINVYHFVSPAGNFHFKVNHITVNNVVDGWPMLNRLIHNRLYVLGSQEALKRIEQTKLDTPIELRMRLYNSHNMVGLLRLSSQTADLN